MKLKIKICLYSFGLILTVLVCSGILLFFIQNSQERKTIAQQQENTLSGLEKVAKEAIITQNDLLFINYIENFKNNQEIKYIILQDKNGKIIGASSFEYLGKVPTDKISEIALSSEQKISQKYFDLEGEEIAEDSLPLFSGKRKLGTLRIGYSQEFLNNIIKQGMTKSGIIFAQIAGISLSLGFILSLFFSKIITSPINKLIFSLKTVAGRNSPNKIKVSTKDEIGILIQEYNSMIDRLNELDELKDEFISTVSHELKSPLTSIVGYLGFLEKEISEKITRRQKKFILIIKENINRLTNFINDILDISLIKARKLELSFSIENLEKLVKERINFYLPQIKEKKINISLEIPPYLNLKVDKERTVQIFNNLISNAIKFTPQNGKISFFAEKEDNFALIKISDTGRGIPAEELEHIFDKFYQAKGNLSLPAGKKGTGLGLTIAKALIESQKGWIKVSSLEGEGTTFSFTLPLADRI